MLKKLKLHNTFLPYIHALGSTNLTKSIVFDYSRGRNGDDDER